MSWAARRQVKLLAIGAVCVVLGGLLFSALRRLPTTVIDPHAFPDAGGDITQKLGPFAFLLAFRGVKPLIASHPEAAVAVAGAATLGVLLFLRFGVSIHDRFFASFNDDVLIPITTSDTTTDRDGEEFGFVRLAWRLGPTGQRREAWNALQSWTEKVGTASRWRRFGRRYSKLYSVGFLVGRSGSGKSRLAAQFARDLTGRGNLHDPGRSTSLARSWKSSSVAAYLRRTMPLAQPFPTDAWDAGVVRNRSSVEQQGQYLEALREWRPRRPTLLIVDDPGDGETGKIHAALCAVAGKAKFPVCLLVIDQIVARDAPIAYDASQQRWMYDRFADADPAPFALSIPAWFDQKDTLQAAFSTRLLDTVAEIVRKDIRDRLYSLTEGNPLLIELSLEWVIEHGSFSAVTVSDLRRARLRRVIDALKRRGVTAPSQWTQLALAAMVGGAPRVRVVEALTLEKVIGSLTDLPSAADLIACFPADALRLNEDRLPAIRPDLLTATLIDDLYDQGIFIGDPAALVRAAFRLEPSSMLRRQRYLSASRHLREALAAIDPAKISGITNLQWALALADHATHTWQGDPDGWTAELHASRFHAFEAVVSRLDAEDRKALLHEFNAMASHDGELASGRRLVPQTLMNLAHTAGQPLLDPMPPPFWTEFYGHFRFTDIFYQGDIGPIDAPLRYAEAIASDPRAVDSFLRSVDGLGAGPQGREFELAIADALLAGAGDSCPTMMNLRLRARRAAMSNPPNLAVLETIWEKLERTVSSKEGIEGEDQVFLADTLWHCAAGFSSSTDHIAQCQAATRALGALVDRHPASAEVRTPLARYLTSLAYSRTQHELDRRSLAAEAEQFARASLSRFRRHLSDDVLLIEVIQAFSYALIALGLIEGGEGATRVAAISSEITDLASGRTQIAGVRRALMNFYAKEFICYKGKINGAGLPEAAATLSRMEPIVQRFGLDASTAESYVEALRTIAFIVAENPDEKSGLAQNAVRRAEEAGQEFPSIQRVQLELAEAMKNEVYALSRAPQGSQADLIESVIRKIEALFLAFSKSSAFLLLLVEAVRHQARAWSLVPLGTGAAATRAAAERITSIIPIDCDDANLLLELAKAHRSEAYAESQVPQGVHAAACTTAADRVEAIANKHPQNVELQREAAEARRNEAFAWSCVPAGEKASDAGSAAKRVLAIAEMFPNVRDVQMEAAEAKRHEAFAWCQVARGAAAGSAAEAASCAERIAASFPEDFPIQREAAEAYRHAIYAWTEVADGRGLGASQAILSALAAICARFPERTDLSSEQQKAIAFVTSAQLALTK